MWFYRLLFIFDALVVAVLGYFFLDGLKYDTGSGPPVIWLPVLGLPIAMLVAAWLLREKGKRGLATVLLLVVAAPPVLYILFFGLLFATNASWQ